MYLLDTNVISELQKKRPDKAVVEWIEGIDNKLLYVSALTFGEIQRGIEITRSQNPQRAELLDDWLNRLLITHNILSMDATSFRIWAKLMYRKSITVNEDAMIAACAIVHHLTVVTRNIRDFKVFEVPLFNPFSD